MTNSSSAWFISYDIRPGKQIERRVVLESLQAARGASISIENYPFVGMGGVRFVDFLLANKILGVTRFTSIEHDSNLIRRCEFNKPFEKLEIYEGESRDYVEQVGFHEPAIIWFEYENGISPDLRDDMVALASAVKPGTFLFVTATAELPARLKKINSLPKRLDQLKQEVEPYADKLKIENVNQKNFHPVAANLMRAALDFGFSGRNDGKFFPFLRLNYKDSIWMMTVGDFFLEPKKMFLKSRRLLQKNVHFLSRVMQVQCTVFRSLTSRTQKGVCWTGRL